MKIKYLLLSVFMLALWSCETDIVNPDEVYPDPYLEIDSGDTDFSTYVSLGASITAGTTDASTFLLGQVNSYPNILANVMSMAGGGEFTQPYVNDNVGGLTLFGNVIAGNLKVYQLHIVPEQVENFNYLLLRLKNLLKYNNFEFEKVDISNLDDLMLSFKKFK